MDKIDRIPFRKEIEDLFRKMPAMEWELFLKAAELVTGYTVDLLAGLTGRYLQNGIVLLSENGYVTTKFALPVAAEEEPEVRMSGSTRVGQLKLKPFFRHCLDCYPLLLDLYPASEHFRLSDSLFPLSFVHEAKGLIYELIRIPEGREEMYQGILLKDALQYQDKAFDAYRESVRRIAVVQAPACAQYVPYVGFSFICVKAETEKGFMIAEKRTGDTWKDLVR